MASLTRMVSKTVSYETSEAHVLQERRVIRKKVALCAVLGVVIFFFSLCFMGAAGQYYPYAEYGTRMPAPINYTSYYCFTPLQVVNVIAAHAHDLVANITHLYPAYAQSWLVENVPGYYAVPYKAQVLGITIISAVLLSISGMLYQNVFRNPIAGPGMLGVGSGVSIGVALLVYIYGSVAQTMLKERYIVCYAAGALILVIVILVGKKLSGKGKPYDIVTMILVGSILSQLLGAVVTFISLFLMDEERYLAFYNISQMLTVDTSLLSWIVLGIAAVASLVPVYILRFKLNALAFREEDIRMFGLNSLALRSVALICGAIMILAAQIHLGAVGLVSLCVPFLARSWFGCEFRKQFVGNICIGIVLLLLCRTLVDMIPFVGSGLAVGSLVSVVMLPTFIIVMTRSARAWE